VKLWVRLALLFVLLGIAPLLILGQFAYQRSQSALLEEAKSHLSSVALLKEDALLEWIEGNLALLESVATRPLVGELSLQIVTTARGTPGWATAYELLATSHLAPNIMAGIEALSILHPESGQILASTERIIEGRFRESEEYFLRGQEASYVDHVRYNVAAEGLALHLSTPIRSSTGELIAVLSAHVDLGEMERIVQLTSGSHESQDIYLINESALFVTEPRFGEGFALRRMLSTEGARAVLLGEVGAAEYLDYRDSEVVGAYRWIGPLSMGLLVETDRGEVLSPMRTLGVTMILGEIIASLVVLVVAVLLAQQVVRPIRRLIAGTEAIGAGDLSHQIALRQRDEFGQLATAFNRMTENLQSVTASRDDLDREVKARAAAEERLRQQWEATKLILDGIPHVIYVTDPATYEVLFVNKYFCDLLGADPVGKLCYEVFQGFEAPCEFCTNDIILQTGKPHTWEYFNPILERHFLITDRIISWSDRPQARLELAMDVTERKTLELEMLRAKEIADSVIESLPGVFYHISTEGRFVRWNHMFTEVTGYTDAEMASMSPTDLFLGGDKDRVAGEIARVFEEGQSSVTADLVAKDGARTAYYFTGMRMIIDDEPSLIGVGTDISEISRIESQLRSSLDELERSNKELEQFAYVASHDLQEPLRMVASYTQLLEKRYKDQLDDDAKDFIHYAVDGANRMQRLINDLLAFSRVQTKGKAFERVDLSSILGSARKNVSTALDESRGIITNDELPMASVDEGQMLSVFQNLLSNAIKFRGDEAPRIHVGLSDQEDEWEITVKDNGIGIDPQFHDRVFVIFQRLHGRDEYSGTGIGLSLCKRIVERHGGRMWVESALGSGTTFHFTLPKQMGEEIA